MIVDRLFVYGTLRSGQPARPLVARHVARWEPASTTGRMVAFPLGYPGLVEDPTSRVVGELVWLEAATLAAALEELDAFEGDEYVRMLKPVQRQDGGEEVAWCYVLADEAAVTRGVPVPDGDWVRYAAGSQ